MIEVHHEEFGKVGVYETLTQAAKDLGLNKGGLSRTKDTHHRLKGYYAITVKPSDKKLWVIQDLEFGYPYPREFEVLEFDDLDSFLHFCNGFDKDNINCWNLEIEEWHVERAIRTGKPLLGENFDQPVYVGMYVFDKDPRFSGRYIRELCLLEAGIERIPNKDNYRFIHSYKDGETYTLPEGGSSKERDNLIGFIKESPIMSFKDYDVAVTLINQINDSCMETILCFMLANSMPRSYLRSHIKRKKR